MTRYNLRCHISLRPHYSTYRISRAPARGGRIANGHVGCGLKQPTFTALSAPQLIPTGASVEDLEQIHSELIALLRKQIEALERDTFVGLSDLERYEYDARHDRIRELNAKLGQFKAAA
jgi:hypothetical protein